ncbi:MAG: VanZ family protein [bacterium]
MSSRVWIYWVPAVLWAGVIWYGSSLSIGTVSPFRFTGVDKLGHLAEYGVLGLLSAWALMRSRPDMLSQDIVQGAMMIGGTWGWVDEVHQYWVPGRTSDPLDMLADLAGAAAGAWLMTRAAGRDRDSEREG